MHALRSLVRISLILLFMTISSSGDTAGGEFDGETVRVFSDSAGMFARPDTGSPFHLILKPGTELLILDQPDSIHVSGGMSTGWVHVLLSSPAGRTGGYIPGADLALTSCEMGADTIFLFGITGLSEDGHGFNGMGRVVHDGSVLAECPHSPVDGGYGGSSYSYDVSSVPADPGGLEGVRRMVLVTFFYPACGFPGADVPFLLTGTELVEGPGAISMWESGIFHYNTYILLPSDEGGEDDMIILQSVSELWDEETGSYVEDARTERTFLWTDGAFTENTPE